MRRELLLFILLAVLLPAVSADCGCGTKCFAYSDPSRCTRCCTATVKRSLRVGPDGRPLRGETFLTPSLAGYRRPKWQQEKEGRDPLLKKLSEILRFMNPTVL